VGGGSRNDEFVTGAPGRVGQLKSGLLQAGHQVVGIQGGELGDELMR
jgi:hypothetical protein